MVIIALIVNGWTRLRHALADERAEVEDRTHLAPGAAPRKIRHNLEHCSLCITVRCSQLFVTHFPFRDSDMSVDANFPELKQRLQAIEDLRCAEAVLNWEQSTYMPAGGAEARGRQLAL